MLTQESNPCDEGVIQASTSSMECEPPSKNWVLAASILGSGMAFINGSVVNVALPAIQTDLSASVSDMQWIINAYAVILGALILTGGSAGDHYGRKKIFAAGIIIFMAASVWCALAPGIQQLIIARTVQGLGGAMLIPSSLALISSAFDSGERGKAIGTWSGFSAITTAFGPILGGWFVDEFSWRLIFFLNIPLALAALLITIRYVPENTGKSASGGLDWWGAFLATAGFGALCYGLIEASDRSFTSPIVIGALAGGLLGTGFFFVVEQTERKPMMPLRLFRSRTFSGANLVTLFLYFALSGVFFFLPFNLIQVQGYSATMAGAAFLPFTLIMGILSRWSGGLIDRYGPKLPLIIGPLITATGFAMLGIPGQGGSYWTTFFPGMMATGLGMAISVAPLTTTVMSAVSQDEAGIASGVNNAVSRISGMLAVAVLGVIIIAIFNNHLSEMMQENSISANIQTDILAESENLAATRIPVDLEANTRQQLKESINVAFISGFRFVMYISAGLALLSALVSWKMIEEEEIT